MYKLGFGTLLAVLSLAAHVQAGNHHCCGACGCQSNGNKVCRLVCEMKTVITYDWALDCEDYCLPGIGGCKVGEVCLPDAQTNHGCRIEQIWKPNCCNKIKTRHTLVKVPIITQVPSYRCVVECRCRNCGNCQTDLQASEEATRELEASGVVPSSAEVVEPATEQTTELQQASAVEAVPTAFNEQPAASKPAPTGLKLLRSVFAK